MNPAAAQTIALLICSNVFMTYAWYGHLKHLSQRPLWMVIVVSWGVAFFEYCLMVPANRTGYGLFSGFQLKILQEVITLVVFTVFAWWVLGERLTWNYAAAFGCLAAAAFFAFGVKP